MKFWFILVTVSTVASGAQAATIRYNFGAQSSKLYDRALLTKFFRDEGPSPSGVAKNHNETNGDYSAKGAGGGPLFPMLRVELPRFLSNKAPSYVRYEDRAAGYLMTVCVGTGCPHRVPFIWTKSRLDRVAKEMARAMAAAGCNLDRPSVNCELTGLKRAMVVMEGIIAHEKLRAMSGGEIGAYTVKGEIGSWDVQDCVDQAANGTSYLMILADTGLMKRHRVYYPGHYMGIQPHWFTRLQQPDGRVLQFDLYHRSEGIGRGAPVKVGLDRTAGAIQ